MKTRQCEMCGLTLTQKSLGIQLVWLDEIGVHTEYTCKLALKASLDAAQARIAELERERTTMIHTLEDLRRVKNEQAHQTGVLHARAVRAEKALRDYGGHTYTAQGVCPAPGGDGPCTCGLDAALAASRAEEKPTR